MKPTLLFIPFFALLIVLGCSTPGVDFNVEGDTGDSDPTDSSTNENDTDDDSSSVGGLEGLSYGEKNTFLVTMSMDAATSWEELAFLAAVPAGMKVNDGKPSVMAVPPGVFQEPEKRIYYDNYLDRYQPDFIYSIGQPSGLTSAVQMASASLDEVTCQLARFWRTSDTAVMVDREDYRASLSASALAGRLTVPLFYSESSGVTNATMACLADLGVQKVVSVDVVSGVASQLQNAGISVDSISDDRAVIAWLKRGGHSLDYFAVCNSGDRSHGYAPKSSLAAPLLAAARGGAVVPLHYPDSLFNDGCLIEGTTTTRPPGAADSADGSWRVGVCTVSGVEYDVVLSLEWTDFGHNQGNIDINRNGNFGDDGEFIRRGQVRNLSGKDYFIDINTRRLSGGQFNKHWADVLITYPTQHQIKADLQAYHDTLTHHPKHMAMVGLPDVLPVALVVDTDGKEVTHFTDQFYSDVDDDPLYDIAMGRIVGEDVSIFTMAASRAITYPHLLDDSWKDRAVLYGNFMDDSTKHKELLLSYGYDADPVGDYKIVDPTQYGFFVHDDHGWPFGHGTLSTGPMAPGFVTTGGCSFGNIIDMIYVGEFQRISEYKDFAAVTLAKTGAVGYHAFSRNATGFFGFGRDVFINAILNDKVTMGEAQLRSVNATTLNHSSSSMEISGIMFYGDPGLKIHLPERTPGNIPAQVVVNGSTATTKAPGQITIYEYPDGDITKYNYIGPGLGGGNYDKGKRFVAVFKTDKTVNKVTQTGSVPSPLGWSNKFAVDEHFDGTSTVYLHTRFHEVDPATGALVQSVDQIDYLME